MKQFIDMADLPSGLMMLLSEDVEAVKYFANLPEAERKRLIDYIKEAPTGEEARKRIEEVVELCQNYEGFF